MRAFAAVAVLLAVVAGVQGQAGDKGKPKDARRYGIDPDLKKYPQGTPKDGLGSVLKALGEKQIDYLLAHLADPAFVDKRVEMYAAMLASDLPEAQKKSRAFEKLVKEIDENFREDPSKLKEMQRFYADGEWEEDEKLAVARLKGLKARSVFMRKIDDRWVILDREK
jgi:hypothetical protein